MRIEKRSEPYRTRIRSPVASHAMTATATKCRRSIMMRWAPTFYTATFKGPSRNYSCGTLAETKHRNFRSRDLFKIRGSIRPFFDRSSLFPFPNPRLVKQRQYIQAHLQQRRRSVGWDRLWRGAFLMTVGNVTIRGAAFVVKPRLFGDGDADSAGVSLSDAEVLEPNLRRKIHIWCSFRPQ